ncbi:MAG: hypothetical protein JWO31_4153, partial [Phycisphaerales bacterium]|nr:hypothetical protein [Phycisphaerales bacterium]
VVQLVTALTILVRWTRPEAREWFAARGRGAGSATPA